MTDNFVRNINNIYHNSQCNSTTDNDSKNIFFAFLEESKSVLPIFTIVVLSIQTLIY